MQIDWRVEALHMARLLKQAVRSPLCFYNSEPCGICQQRLEDADRVIALALEHPINDPRDADKKDITP